MFRTEGGACEGSGRCLTAAGRFGLRYEEIEGSRDLVHPLLYGPWDERFIVVPQGGTVCLSDFLTGGAPGGEQLPARHVTCATPVTPDDPGEPYPGELNHTWDGRNRASMT